MRTRSRFLQRHGAIVAALLVVFVASRVAARRAGVQFNEDPLGHYFQYADPKLLRHDLLRTLWYFHAQPPGFNAFLGTVLHLPHDWQLGAFVLVYLVCGVVIMVAMYALATGLSVPHFAAAALALVFAISPAALVYENLLFYPYPVAAMLCVIFLALLKYLRTSSAVWGAVLFGMSTLLVFTRATYHVLWLVGLFVVVILARPSWRRRTCGLALLPLLLTIGLYTKDALLFHTFSTSSWFGMNFARVVQPPRDLRHGLAPPFHEPSAFGANERNPTGVPVLDEQRTSSGAINYNNIVYVDAGRRYLEADLESVRRDPLNFVRAFGRGVTTAFESPTRGQGGLAPNVTVLAPAERLYDAVIGWQIRQYSYKEAQQRRQEGQAPDAMHISWSTVLVYGFALATLPAVVWRVRRRKQYDTAKAWTLAAASTSIWLSFIADNAFDVGENARFRFETDPLALVLAAVAVTAIARVAWRAHRTSTGKRHPKSTISEHQGTADLVRPAVHVPDGGGR